MDSIGPEYIQSNAVPLDSLVHLPENLVFLSNYKIIILGEVHGINETPEMTLGIVKLLSKLKKPLILALEIWGSEQETFNQFMKSGSMELLKQSPFFNYRPQYGIGSLAMANLLQQVRKLPNVQLLCFDRHPLPDQTFIDQSESIRFSEERDFFMAKRVLEKFKENENSILILLTGNLHGSTELTTIFGIEYKPMGYWLSHVENSKILPTDLFSIQLKFERGKSWNGISVDGAEITYGVHKMGLNIDVYSQAVDWEKYFLGLDRKENGYNAIFFTREITPSFPLIQQ